MAGANGNGRNGAWRTWALGVAGALVMFLATLGIQTEMRRREALDAFVRDIASDRDKQTVIIDRLREDIADLKRRVDGLDARTR